MPEKQNTAFNPEYTRRVSHIRASLTKIRAEGLLVTDLHNLRYLSGFTGSSGFAFITGKKNLFVTDFRYEDQAQKEVVNLVIDQIKDAWYKSLGEHLE